LSPPCTTVLTLEGVCGSKVTKVATEVLFITMAKILGLDGVNVLRIQFGDIYAPVFDEVVEGRSINFAPILWLWDDDSRNCVVHYLWTAFVGMTVGLYQLCNRCQLKKSKKKVRSALHAKCTFWSTLGEVHRATVGIGRKYTRSKKCVPFGTLGGKCTKRCTALRTSKTMLSFVVFSV